MKTDKLGRSPLHYVALDYEKGRQSMEIVRLVQEGYECNQQDKNGWTPLHFATQENSLEAVEALIRAGADVDIVDEHGNTPLWRAVFSSKGNGEVIKALLKAGANPNRPNLHGVSPQGLAGTIANYDLEPFFR